MKLQLEVDFEQRIDLTEWLDDVKRPVMFREYSDDYRCSTFERNARYVTAIGTPKLDAIHDAKGLIFLGTVDMQDLSKPVPLYGISDGCHFGMLVRIHAPAWRFGPNLDTEIAAGWYPVLWIAWPPRKK